MSLLTVGWRLPSVPCHVNFSLHAISSKPARVYSKTGVNKLRNIIMEVTSYQLCLILLLEIRFKSHPFSKGENYIMPMNTRK